MIPIVLVDISIITIIILFLSVIEKYFNIFSLSTYLSLFTSTKGVNEVIKLKSLLVRIDLGLAHLKYNYFTEVDP